MSKITIQKKDRSLTFDEIHELLFEAHQDNINNGMKMKTAFLTGKELEQRIGKDGVCFVAFDGDKLVGTISVRFVKRNTWYAKNKIVPDYMLAGVLPEYRGKGINSLLSKEVFNYIKQLGYDFVELDTAENNIGARKVYEHLGFKNVDFKAFENSDHYSVVMVKWLNACPYSDIYCNIMYILRKMKIKIKYKKGRIKRFGGNK